MNWWLARDKSGSLHLFERKPIRHLPPFLKRWWKACSDGEYYWQVDGGFYTLLSDCDYPNFNYITWNHEPQKVHLHLTTDLFKLHKRYNDEVFSDVMELSSQIFMLKNEIKSLKKRHRNLCRKITSLTDKNSSLYKERLNKLAKYGK